MKIRAPLFLLLREAATTLQLKSTIFIIMVETSTPISNVWQPFVFERDPNFLTICQSNHKTSAQRERDIHDHPNFHEVSTISLIRINRVNNFSKYFANLLNYFHIHIFVRDTMDLHSKHSSVKLQRIHQISHFISFHDHKMFVKIPWFTMDDIFYFRLVIKNKQYLVVTYIPYLKTITRSPQWGKSFGD